MNPKPSTSLRWRYSQSGGTKGHYFNDTGYFQEQSKGRGIFISTTSTSHLAQDDDIVHQTDNSATGKVTAPVPYVDGPSVCIPEGVFGHVDLRFLQVEHRSVLKEILRQRHIFLTCPYMPVDTNVGNSTLL